MPVRCLFHVYIFIQREVKAAAGALDDPSDEGVINVRLWRERLDEGLPGAPQQFPFTVLFQAKLFCCFFLQPLDTSCCTTAPSSLSSAMSALKGGIV